MNGLMNKNNTNLEETKNQFGTNNISQSKEMTKAIAEVQARVILAKQFPRNIVEAENLIKASCERRSLAEVCEYEYTRGSSRITGATIKLLEVVAQCYGNVQSGWDVMDRDVLHHISHCKAFAWDLERNNYYELKFDVPHVREKKSGNEILDNPRDIYELEANQASSRVRKCLETIVPRDLVEQARAWCNETLVTKTDIQGGIDKAIEVFKEKYHVTLNQIEEYMGMSRQGFNKNQYLSLQKLYTSLRDGVATVEELFPTKKPVKEEVEEEINDTIISDDELTKLLDTIVAKGLDATKFLKDRKLTFDKITKSQYEAAFKDLEAMKNDTDTGEVFK